MEITSVTADPIRRDVSTPFANAQKWITSREYCLVRVETRDGTVGWGECWGPIAGNREILDKRIAPWLEGQDVTNREWLVEELRFQLESAYHSFVPASTISGVEIALWDAHARLLGASIASLLGGRRRSSVDAYATGHYFRQVDDLDALCALIADEAAGHVAAGFDAVKQKIGLARHFDWDWHADMRLVESVRDAIGPDIDLYVDANHAYDVPTAVKVARALEAYDIGFFEEPVRPRIHQYEQLATQVSVPIATGECFAFERPFIDLIDAGAIDLVQPDITSVGGISTTHRIGTIAESAGIPCYPHVFGSGIALAASLQVLAAIPGEPVLEFDRTPNPLREGLVTPAIEHDGSSVSIPDAPGIGVEIHESNLEPFRVDVTELT